jgi:NAD-dependent deacetylase
LSLAGVPDFPSGLIQSLRNAERAVLSGSGVSAESGVPTFREALTGLWERFDIQELATPGAFARDPRLVWEWYGWRLKLVTEVEPNPGGTLLTRHAAFVLQGRAGEV